jgi:hypothetical protein
MARLSQNRFAVPALVLAVIVGAGAALGSWLPLVAALPWLVAIIWFGSRDTGPLREFPSAAESARERLWSR